MSFNGAHVFYTAMLCMFVLCYGVYIKKPTFLKPDGISCTLGERDIYDIYADTFINSGLWLSKLEKMFFVIHRVKLSYCCCYFLYVET